MASDSFLPEPESILDTWLVGVSEGYKKRIRRWLKTTEEAKTTHAALPAYSDTLRVVYYIGRRVRPCACAGLGCDACVDRGVVSALRQSGKKEAA